MKKALVILVLVSALPSIGQEEGADPGAISGLIEQLGDPDFAVREEASSQLESLGEAAVAELERAKQHPDLEVRMRAEAILTAIRPADGETPSADSPSQIALRANGVVRIQVMGGQRTNVRILPQGLQPAPAPQGGKQAAPRVITDAQRAAVLERLKAAREARRVALVQPAEGAAPAAPENPAQAPRSEYLGIVATPLSAERRTALGIEERGGFCVESVAAGSAPERAGLAAGDVVLGACGSPVEDLASLRRVSERLTAGDPLPLEVVREGKRLAIVIR